MSTARTIIKRAMQRAGILTKGEVPAADEAVDALSSLNNMLGAWSNNSLNISARAWETFTLSGGVAAYTIGTGQTFNTTRPTNIVGAYIRQSGSVDSNLAVIDDEQYISIQTKNTGGVPYFLNYDNAFPTGTVRLFPTPSTAYQLFILSEKPLSSFGLDDEVSYPAGWEEAIIDNLAVRLSPEYGQAVSPDLKADAMRGMGEIKLSIAKNRPLNAYATFGGSYDIRSGYYD